MAKTGMSRGRPVSVALHSLELSKVAVVPDPPASLGVAGRRLWADVFQAAVWLNLALDGYLVEQVALLADDMVAAREEIGRSGTYQRIPNGSLVRSAAVVDLEHLAVQQNAYLSALGLTPSDRARLGVQGVDVDDPLRELERRREERRQARDH